MAENISTQRTFGQLPANKNLVSDMKGKSLFLQVRHLKLVTAAEVMLKDFGVTYGKDLNIIPVRSLREAIQEILTDRGNGMAYAAVPGLAQAKPNKKAFTPCRSSCEL
ncbi:hypothetical protein OAJ57_01895 [Alphaproteobacteria bacterium]|nr:hypothetical protein [Alphaproteobacteria bacterium]